MRKYSIPLTYYAVTSAQDEGGQLIDTDATGIRVWANLSTLSGQEIDGNDVEQAYNILKIETRYHPTIVVKGRFTWQGRTFNIRSINNVDEANKELHIVAVENL